MDLLEFEPEKVKKIVEEDNFLSHKFFELKEASESHSIGAENIILESIFKVYIQGHPMFEFKYSQIR